MIIKKSKIAELIRKSGKKPGRDAILKIDKTLEEQAQEIIKKARRKADFAGRKIILEKDLD